MTRGHGASTRRYSSVLSALVFAAALYGQGRGGPDWSTSGGDAQRSSWVRTDPKISLASMVKPGFQFIWKVKLKDRPLSAPVLLDRYIGYRGFRTYAFIGGAGEDAFALDSDLARIEWQKHYPISSATSTANCPGGMTAAVTRSVESAFPSANAGRGGGRGGPAHSGVGEPFQGAVTLSQSVMAAPAPNAAGRGPAAGAAPPRRMPSYLHSLTSDGAFHTMYVSNGDEPQPAIPFLKPDGNVTGFSIVDGVAYATTVNGCGGTADGIYALDLESKAIASWKGNITGEPSFGPSGTLHLTSQNQLVTLAPRTLEPKASFDAGQLFTAAPVVFEHGGKVWIAAATKDGVVHLLDEASPAAAAAKSAAGEESPYALATWQSTSTRWIVSTAAHSITAWKVTGNALEQGWTSRDVQSSAAPLIVNGILFAVSRGSRDTHSVLYAIDAATGKPLWNSSASVTSFVPKAGGLAAGGSSIYFGTNDGTFWAFGFPIEH